LNRLNEGLQRRLLLVSAPAGSGKTTLLAEWLTSVPISAVWLSLDRSDDHLPTFVAYFVAAIRTVFPDACCETLALLQAPQLPATRRLAQSLIEDISQLQQDFILVLDDYHFIREPEVHKLVLALLYRTSRRLHLVLSARTDPPLSISRLRAQRQLVELRGADLQFGTEEARMLVEEEAGARLPASVIDALVERTEGWAVGLRLAALSLRGHSDPVAFADAFRNTLNQHILDYLTEDVLVRQPKPVQQFLLRTSILERFNADLGDALSDDAQSADSAVILRRIERSNLFVTRLDDQGEWVRYHHLFRDALQHRLKHTCGNDFVARLHARASAWFAQHGLIEEALQHALASGDMALAADLVEQYKHDWLNHEQWRTLEGALSLLPDETVQTRPALLLARVIIWLVQGNLSGVLPRLEQAQTLIGASAGGDKSSNALLGESDMVRSYVALFAMNDAQTALACAQRALEYVPVTHAYVRGLAMLFWAIAAQLTGQFKTTVHTLNRELDSIGELHSRYAPRLLFALSTIHSAEGYLDELAEYAGHHLRKSAEQHLTINVGWAHYWLGVFCYERDELDAAAAHFSANTQRSHGLNAQCAHDSFVGLALTYQAQGKPIQANETAAALAEFDSELLNPHLLAETRSLHARLALLQGALAPAMLWAQTADVGTNLKLMVYLEIPALTHVKALIASGIPEHTQRAAQWVEELLAKARSMHSTRREIEILALQALALHAQGQLDPALDALQSALALGEHRGFVRTFVDLGEPMRELLKLLVRADRQAAYATRLLAAFTRARSEPAAPEQPALAMLKTTAVELELIEPLTDREFEVLSLLNQHLSNKEIGQALFISQPTVKSHTTHIFHKLGVTKRREAVHRARTLGLLPLRQ
jgi:LuxR family maltose regulon positive regulatory protein